MDSTRQPVTDPVRLYVSVVSLLILYKPCFPEIVSMFIL